MSLSRPVAIKHSITAGAAQNFNGAQPPGVPTKSNSVIRYAPHDTNGGLFDTTDPDISFNKTEMIDLIGVHYASAGQTSWSLVREDVDGEETTLFSGTNETGYSQGSQAKHTLIYGDKLKFVTAGAAGDLHLTLIFEPHIPYRSH